MPRLIFALKQEMIPHLNHLYEGFNSVAKLVTGDYVVSKISNFWMGDRNHHFNENIELLSDLVYDVDDKHFVKNSFSSSSRFPRGAVPFPAEIYDIFEVIMEIAQEKEKFSYLQVLYSKDLLLKAVYLTDTYSVYSKYIDCTEYHAICLKFGEKLSNDIIKDIVVKYPEKLI